MTQKHIPYPDWVLKHRRPGIEIRRINDRFYVYEVSAFYDKEKKKGRKKTGKYLGSITEKNGFVESKSVKVPKGSQTLVVKDLSTREYGLSAFIQEYCKEVVDGLKNVFPDEWERILVALYCRLRHTSPLKNMAFYFEKSYLSVQLDISANAKTMASLLHSLGANRDRLTGYMKMISGGKEDDWALIDATSVVSYSRQLRLASTGLTKQGTYEPIFNLLYFYSPKHYHPAYYRLFKGDIRDVKMLKTAIEESGLKNSLVIADKGFFCEENLVILEGEKLKYIVPLKRNCALIDKSRLDGITKTTNHFIFNGRVIYFDSYSVSEKRKIYLFTDETIMAKEKRDYLVRVEKHPQNYTPEKFMEKMPDFGSLALITNQFEQAQTVYTNYKSRIGVEVLFDGVKNILGNDHTYMRDDTALEGWMFINHLALLVHHKIYSLLSSLELLSKYSIRDFIEFLAGINKVRINGKWHDEPVTAQQKKLLKDAKVAIT
jgi:transposase